MTDTAFVIRADRPPRPVSVAFTAMVVALLCGVGEALTYTAATLDGPDADVASLATGLGVRTVIYAVVLAVTIRMARGDRWARAVLTFGIGVIGLASLIMEPLAAWLSAKEFGDLFTDIGTTSIVTATFRIAHIVAVLIAIPAMYAPAARTYFRAK